MSYVVKRMTDVLEAHLLEEVTQSTSPVRSFYLRPPSGGSRRATLLTFTPEGIAIQGDLCPGTDGALAKGFDLAWFEGDVSEEDLCDAFLKKGFQLLAAARDLRTSRYAENSYLARLADLAEFGHVDEDHLRRALFEAGLSFQEVDQIGYDFPLDDAGWLCAIQRRFKALRAAA